MVPHDPADIYDVIVGSCRLQSLRNKNVLSAKITHSEFTFITIVQNETEDEFELYLGRESPLEEFQVPVCTDDDLLELATSNTAFLRSLAIELMKFAAACAPILDANIDAITKEAHEAALVREAERDADYEDVVAQNCALEEQLVQATENTRKLETSLTQQQREYNDVVARLQRYDHNFRPYTLQRREDRGRNSHLSTQRNRRHESPERRTDRRTASPNPYPSRQATPVVTRPAPRPRGDSHSRSRSRSRRDRANPLNQDPHRYIPPPYNGQQSVQQAASTVGGLSLSFKLPDIEVWKGNDDTKNYDKWRRSAIQKCESLPEDKQLAYLEMKVDGAAWQYIDDLKFEHYPPPYNGQQSVQQAASTVGGLSLSFKLPDIEVWKGNDDTKNYDKWRRSAIQKCESLPEDKQLAYLEMARRSMAIY
ncbi:PRP38-assoc multi-domain protein [Pyrenophora tritici-repentis]|uniref:PRP38-assoc multi-domain protein n=1 Tax=Pyrenophora tritici-repentis TaxID=45151 RepID=A0A316ZKH3_9PLEO|nr:PRP38-assoc multi-domain protein [Pyrenophora tritici-repentis]